MYLGSNASGFYYLQISESGIYSCSPVSKAGVGESATVNLTVVGKYTRVTEEASEIQRLDSHNTGKSKWVTFSHLDYLSWTFLQVT